MLLECTPHSNSRLSVLVVSCRYVELAGDGESLGNHENFTLHFGHRHFAALDATLIGKYTNLKAFLVQRFQLGGHVRVVERPVVDIARKYKTGHGFDYSVVCE